MAKWVIIKARSSYYLMENREFVGSNPYLRDHYWLWTKHWTIFNNYLPIYRTISHNKGKDQLLSYGQTRGREFESTLEISIFILNKALDTKMNTVFDVILHWKIILWGCLVRNKLLLAKRDSQQIMSNNDSLK